MVSEGIEVQIKWLVSIWGWNESNKGLRKNKIKKTLLELMKKTLYKTLIS